MTQEMQGYAYAFVGILSINIFLELGFTQNILQFTSHEAAKLTIKEDGTIKGDQEAKSRLISLGRLSFKYYMIAASLFLLCLLIGGGWFFSTSHKSVINWMWPWVLSSTAASLTLCLNPCWALLEGCNFISKVEKFRFISSLVSFVGTVAALVAGWGLFAMATSAILTLIVSIFYLGWRWRRFFLLFTQPPTHGVISWRRELWPFQWRIGVSWICGYFVFYAITPIVFRINGPIEAGKLGFTLQIVRAVSSVASTWLVTKLPLFGMLVAKEQWQTLEQVWRKSTITTIAVAVIGSIGVVTLLFIGGYLYEPLSERYAGSLVTSILSCGMICQCFTSSGAYVIRAFRVEPYMRISIYTAIISVLLIVPLSYKFAIVGASIGYTGAILLVAWPSYRLFRTKYSEFSTVSEKLCG